MKTLSLDARIAAFVVHTKTQINGKSTSTTTAMSLSGKVAIVTGGSKGIGKAISQRLASDGAFVVMSSTLATMPRQPKRPSSRSAPTRPTPCRATLAPSRARTSWSRPPSTNSGRSTPHPQRRDHADEDGRDGHGGKLRPDLCAECEGAVLPCPGMTPLSLHTRRKSLNASQH